jgi:hypothetical protein
VAKGKAPDELLDTYEEERMPVAREVLKSTNASTNLVVSRNPALRFVRDRTLSYVMGSGLIQETLLKRVSQLDVNYRKSSLSKSCTSPQTLLPGRRQDRFRLKDWLNLRSEPKAGDRAPQGRCLRYPSREETSLFQEFEGANFTLLLFDGPAQTAEGYANLTGVARKIEELWGEDIKTYVVVAGDDKPEDLDWAGLILLDTGRELHETYNAAGAEALYLIRPDGYVGFRGQPVHGDRLLRYLGDLLSATPEVGESSERYAKGYADKTSTTR